VLVYKLFDRIVHEHEIRHQRTSTHQQILHGTFAKLRISLDSRRFSAGYGGATMPGVKQASKRKRVTKAVPALGAVGLTFSLVGGASASAVPTADTPQTPNMAPGHEITLGEEEMADVSLATFYVFDKENAGTLRGLVHEARGCGGCGRGCGGCRGCRGGVGVGCRGCVAVGCRGCGCGGGCGVGWGVGGCCASWGACRWC
jgi:hypothetical protein